MPAFDWPLTIFTLTTQVVLGAFAVLWVTDLLARQLADTGEQEELTRVGVWLLGPLMVFGFAASTMHLGQPMYAYRALSNLSTSWLSREILFLGGFFALGAVYALLWWRYRERFPLRATLGAVVGVIGAVGLASMTMLYLVPAMPSWYGASTPLSFVASALVLGPLLVAGVFLTVYRWRGTAEALQPLLGMHLRAMGATVLAGAGLSAAALVWKLARLSTLGLEGDASLALFTVEHRWLLIARVAAWLAGIALVAVLLWRLRRAEPLRGAAVLVWSTLLAFSASELVGRLLFYATAVPLRPPGPFA